MAGDGDTTPQQEARRAPYRGDSRNGEIELLAPRRIFTNAYIEAFNDRVRFPNGSEGESFRWYWTAPYGVIALPYLPDGAVVLIEQFRHMDRAWRLEAPRGFGKADEDPADAARREVAEETGLSVCAVHPVRSIGHAAYPVHLFFVAVTPPCDNAPVVQGDPQEAIAARHIIPADSVRDLLNDPRIHDAESLLLISQILMLKPA
jgi:ADP-ribose pyrophosphatase